MLIFTEKQMEDFAAEKAAEKSELMAGKITVRWLQSSASFHIFAGTRRLCIQSFENELHARDWLKDTHGIEINL